MADIDDLLAFGQMAFDLGQYERAKEYYKQALALDAANQEAIDGLSQVDEMLRRRMPVEAEIQPQSSLSIVEWVRKKREERAEKVAEAERLAAEEKEKRAREIEELKKVWAEKRAKLGYVPLQLGQCPECGSMNSWSDKEVSGLGCLAMILTFPISLLVFPFLPEVHYCRVCGARWKG